MTMVTEWRRRIEEEEGAPPQYPRPIPSPTRVVGKEKWKRNSWVFSQMYF